METNKIAGFFLEDWYVFDNFSAFQIEWRGSLYPTAEHAYQAAHFLDTKPELAEQVRLCRSPREAADFANAHSHYDPPQWKEKRLEIMEEILRAKVSQHPSVLEALKNSGDLQIVEMNNTDSFWGWGPDHKGQNTLGIIWMKLRAALNA